MTISFDSGRHEQLLAGLTAATEDIEAALTKLEDRVQTLRSGWDGAARDAYDTAQSAWSAAMTTMREILAEAEDGAATAGDTMRAAENAARAIWS